MNTKRLLARLAALERRPGSAPPIVVMIRDFSSPHPSPCTLPPEIAAAALAKARRGQAVIVLRQRVQPDGSATYHPVTDGVTRQ